MGREGRGSMGKGFCEQDSFLSQTIDIRCFQMFSAVAAQPVWSQGIYGDEKDIDTGLTPASI